jgi:hypothetical protein
MAQVKSFFPHLFPNQNPILVKWQSKRKPVDAVIPLRKVQPVPVFFMRKLRLDIPSQLERQGIGPSIRITHKSGPSWLHRKVKSAMSRLSQIFKGTISQSPKPTIPGVKSPHAQSILTTVPLEGSISFSGPYHL